MQPQRIQLRRTKGWRMPPNTVSVARPNKHGNPFRVGDFGIPDAAAAKQRYREWREGRVVGPPLPSLDDLRGKNLACWCPLNKPCHADVQLELANARPLPGDRRWAVTRCGVARVTSPVVGKMAVSGKPMIFYVAF